jgi:hypothetical protein
MQIHTHASDLIKQLKLESHIEGGYYRRTFQSDHRPKLPTKYGERYTMTSIYYLLTKESHFGNFHLNKSDIIHFFHLGDPITYYTISPEGELHDFTLGPKPNEGHVFQQAVPGGYWKASTLPRDMDYGYGLISEAVAPGFLFEDMTLGRRTPLLKEFPQHTDLITKLTRG